MKKLHAFVVFLLVYALVALVGCSASQTDGDPSSSSEAPSSAPMSNHSSADAVAPPSDGGGIAAEDSSISDKSSSDGASASASDTSESPDAPSSGSSDADGVSPSGNQNDLVAGSAWISGDDHSYMVFLDDGGFAWYQDPKVVNDNYFSGTYEFYAGNDALTYLTVDLAEFGVTKEEILDVILRADLYSLDNLVCFTVNNESFLMNGVEQLSEPKPSYYYGFFLEDRTYLDVANMVTGTYYGFLKE